MRQIDWPEPNPPGLGEKVVSWLFALVVVGFAIYFGAHVLVAMGVGCG